ncbi:NF-kappa-B essential modulator isoform X2 [Harmonia axyridis]|uniref:NF-kappa-B essential modulator isoform X2 n=1 Tax=Harmonia axyridis TaxID=115357 RepID=UPI001E275189|nr:NF-kappa-B essential modulator isoform X2 [Harmonia axyridis]
MSSSGEFKIPEGPQRMATMDSEDEESFVVLGQSLMPDIDLSFKNLSIGSVEIGPIEEGRKLLNMDLSQLGASGIIKGPDITQMSRSQDPAISMHSISSTLSPTVIQEKIEMLIDENVKLRDIITKNNEAMEAQHEKILAWKEEVHITHKLHKDKFEQAKNCISSLVHEKEHLISELEKNKEIRRLQEVELFQMKDELKNKIKQLNVEDIQGSTSTSDKEKSLLEIENLKKELNEVMKKKAETDNFLKIVYAQKDDLKKKKDNLEIQKNNIILNLEQELKNKETMIEEMKTELKDKEESSKKKIEELSSEINYIKSQASASVNLKEDLENARKQLMTSQESITRLLQTNSVLEAQVTAETEKVRELKKLEVMKDGYVALQHQLEIYKADFEEEKRLKENYKAENRQLASDFQQVQKRNGELQNELEILKEHGWEYVKTTRRTSSTSSASAEIRYNCPICKFGFLTYQALENHVERCMDLSSSLP